MQVFGTILAKISKSHAKAESAVEFGDFADFPRLAGIDLQICSSF